MCIYVLWPTRCRHRPHLSHRRARPTTRLTQGRRTLTHTFIILYTHAYECIHIFYFTVILLMRFYRRVTRLVIIIIIIIIMIGIRVGDFYNDCRVSSKYFNGQNIVPFCMSVSFWDVPAMVNRNDLVYNIFQRIYDWKKY